jgi:hypothetical protein
MMTDVPFAGCEVQPAPTQTLPRRFLVSATRWEFLAAWQDNFLNPDFR